MKPLRIYVALPLLLGILFTSFLPLTTLAETQKIARQQSTLQVPSPTTSITTTPTSITTSVATPSTTDPSLILERANLASEKADSVVALAEGTVLQTTRTVELVRNLAWFFGLIIAVAAVILGYLGYNIQRGFQDSIFEYKQQLNTARADFQEAQKNFKEELDKFQQLQLSLSTKVEDIEAFKKELNEMKDRVQEEFSSSRQSLVLLSLGNRLFGEGKRQQAIDTYLEARRLQPDNDQINYHLGIAYSEAGRYEEAISSFERALHARPDLAEGHLGLGLSYRRHADLAKTDDEKRVEYRLAERHLRRAIEIRPNYDSALAILGGLYRREGRYKESLECYQRALAVKPNSSYALGNVASLLLILGQKEQAQIAFERVERLANDYVEAKRDFFFWDVYDRALAKLVLGRKDDAIEDYRYAISLTPDIENFKSVLSNLYALKSSPLEMPGLEEVAKLVEAQLPKA